MANGSVIELILENSALEPVHMLRTGGWERMICGEQGPSMSKCRLYRPCRIADVHGEIMGQSTAYLA